MLILTNANQQTKSRYALVLSKTAQITVQICEMSQNGEGSLLIFSLNFFISYLLTFYYDSGQSHQFEFELNWSQKYFWLSGVLT